MNPAKIVAIAVLISLMLHTGLQVNLAHLGTCLRNYGLLGRALLANFILVPIYGVVIARVFHLSEPIATGLLLMAISPGVPFVVLGGGRTKGGSLGFAVELAFLLPAFSIVTVPITASLVLPGAHVSTSSIVASLLIFQLLPLLVGIFINERAPEVAARLQRIVGLVVIIVIVMLFVLLGPGLVHAIATVYGSRGIFAMLSVVLLSLLTGWALGGSERAYRRTLSAGTALRNIGLSAVIATTSFGGGAVADAVLTYLIIQMVLVTLVGIFYTRTAKDSDAHIAV
jgi:BASS family bile acid:Na+ symporter